MIQPVAGLPQPVLGQVLGDLGDAVAKARKNPAVFRVGALGVGRCVRFPGARRRREALHVGQDHPPVGLPQLVAQAPALLEDRHLHVELGLRASAVAGGAGHRQLEVLVEARGERQDAVAQRVGAVDLVVLHAVGGDARRRRGLAPDLVGAPLDDLHRVEAVAPALGHDVARLVEDGPVDVDVVKGRDPVHELHAHHDHARHPQRQDVAGGDEHVGGVEVAQVRRVVGPAQRGDGPKLRGKPRVEHVGVLHQVAAAALRALRRRGVRIVGVGHDGPGLARHGLGITGRVQLEPRAAVHAVPDGDAVAPPDLAGDAPVRGGLQPAQIIVAAPGRVEGHLVLVGVAAPGPLHQGVHLDEPLVRKIRLHDGARAVAVGHRVGERLDVAQPPFGPQVFHHLGAGLVDGSEPLVGSGVFVEGPVGVEDVDHGQAVAQPALIVVEVVPRGHLHRAGALLRVGQDLVGDDGDVAVHQRQAHRLAHQVAVALVGGVHRHRGVGQHGLGPGGGHGDHPRRVVGERVVQVPK